MIAVPFKYLYPSRLPKLWMRYGISYVGMAWAILLGFAILNPEWAERTHAIDGEAHRAWRSGAETSV